MGILSKTTAALRQAAALVPLRLEAIVASSRFRDAIGRTEESQQRALMTIVRGGAKSGYGKAHGFSKVKDVADFRAAVPIGTYEDFAPYIERVKQGETGALFSPRQRVHMFALTSGTTGPAKYIPVTDESLQHYRRGWHIWGLQMFRDHPEANRASTLQLTSRIDEQLTSNGTPCGSVSGLLAKMQRLAVRNTYAVPHEVSEARDTDTKYYLAARMALARESVIPVTANPSTLIGLARLMNQRKDELLRDVADGSLAGTLDFPRSARAKIERMLAPLPHRVAGLEKVIRQTGTLYPKDAWKIPIIGTWKGGTLTIYLEQFPKYFGTAPIRDIGLIASEGRVSIPMRDEGSAGVLDVSGCFFEFLPETNGPSAEPLLAHQLEVGQMYTLIMTTHCGLYRYNIQDRVRVTRFAKQTPVIEFLSRGSAISSITGEKLTEFQVVSAVNETVKELGLPITSYVICPTWADTPYYSLLIEDGEIVNDESAGRLADEVDRRLRQGNIEYASKRSSGRLGSVRIKTVPRGTWTAFDAREIESQGRRPEQYKHKFLDNCIEFEKQFEVQKEFPPLSV